MLAVAPPTESNWLIVSALQVLCTVVLLACLEHSLVVAWKIQVIQVTGPSHTLFTGINLCRTLLSRQPECLMSPCRLTSVRVVERQMEQQLGSWGTIALLII